MTKAEKIMYILAICFLIAGVLAYVLNLSDLHKAQMISGIIFSCGAILLGFVNMKRCLPVSILMWFAAALTIYSDAVNLIRMH